MPRLQAPAHPQAIAHPQAALPWLAIIAAMVICGLNSGVRHGLAPFLVPLAEQLQIGRGSVAQAIAVQSLLWGFASPITGMLADRLGALMVFIAGAFLYALGIALPALSASAGLGLGLGWALLAGLGVGGTGLVLVLGQIAHITPPRHRSLAFGITTAGGSIGQAIFLPLGDLGRVFLGWQPALLLMAAACFLIIPCAFVLINTKPQSEPKTSAKHTSIPGPTPGPISAANPAPTPGPTPGPISKTKPGPGFAQTLRRSSRHHGYWMLNFGYFVCGFHISFIGYHLPGYVATLGFSPSLGATALGVIGLSNTLGVVLFGALGGVYRKKLLLCGLYTARVVVICALLLSPPSVLGLYLFALAFGLLWLSTVPLTSGLVGDLFGTRYLSSLFGITMLFHQLGAFFGLIIGGLSFDLTQSYTLAWQIAVALGLFAGALHFLLDDTPSSHRSAQAAAT